MISKMPGKMIMIAALVLLTAVGACGNYSNEDLDFQLALPEQSDIEVKMQTPVPRVDSAEYYKATRTAVLAFNGLVGTLAALIDAVRVYTPTSRNGDQRIWGPFADDKHPTTWQVRVVMTKSVVSSSLLKMNYEVDVRPMGAGDDAWVAFLVGDYTSGGGARKGIGNIHLQAQVARDGGYPVDDDAGLKDLDHLDVYYDNSAFPVAVNLSIVNVPTANTQSGTYDYQEQSDGSGAMQFDWQGVDNNGTTVRARMKSEWLGTGQGRGDLFLSPDGLNIRLGTDCWLPDTSASYSYRLEGKVTTGDLSTCAF
jgi:hypothetical protein